MSVVHLQFYVFIYLFNLLSPFTPFSAPMELPVKSRSFSLTSHQLRALTQLACILLRFESDASELVTSMTFLNCTEDAPCVKGTA